MNEVQTPSGNLAPDRGVVILVLGLVAIPFPCIGIITGFLAWTMGKADLQAMAAGTMSREGESLTRVGSIIGLIVMIFHLLVILVFILLMLGILTLKTTQAG